MPVAATPSWPAGVASPIANLLPFAMGEPTYGDDKPPSLSATQTPVSQEAALLSIANTLRRERVRFAVISSTDPLDNIFLIRFLRTHCPDLRMITFESDLLYVRAATEFPATGVMLVTTYPLFLQNQVWTGYGSSEDRVQFVSMGSEGTYNAFRSILMDSAGGVPAGGDRPLDYQVPFEPHTRKPPVWLTVTTPNGYWPLAVLGDDDGKGNHGLQPSLGSKLLYSWPYEEQKNQPDAAGKAGNRGRQPPLVFARLCPDRHLHSSAARHTGTRGLLQPPAAVQLRVRSARGQERIRPGLLPRRRVLIAGHACACCLHGRSSCCGVTGRAGKP